MGLKSLANSNDSLRYSLVPLERVSLSSISEDKDTERKCSVESGISEGRARDGGLRVGEMESEVLHAHGVISFLKEKMLDCSDNYRIFICKKCKMMATEVNTDKNIYKCHNCKNEYEFAEVRIPYAAKLLMQEIQSTNIATRFNV